MPVAAVLEGGPSETASEARCGKPRLGALLDAAGHPTLFGPLGDRFGDGGGDAFVENGGDDVVLGKIFLRDHTCYRIGGGELHRLVYFAGPHVEGAPEDAGGTEDVVDLVRVVAASGGDDPRLPQRYLGPYLGVGVGHGEDDGVGVHALYLLEVQNIGRGEAEKEVGPGDGFGEIAGPALGVGILGEPPLGLVEVLASLMHDALRVASDEVLHACGYHDLGACHPRSANTVHDYAEIFHLLADELEGVDQGGQHHDGRAVLVVVKDGDVKVFLQAFFDLEAPRGRDVLQVYTAERRRQILHGLDDRVRVLRVEADRERVDVRELFEERRLALHHRHRGPRPNVPKTEDGRTVRDYGDRIALDGEVEGPLGITGYRPADARYTGRIHHREVVPGADLELGADLDLATQVHEERPV